MLFHTFSLFTSKYFSFSSHTFQKSFSSCQLHHHQYPKSLGLPSSHVWWSLSISFSMAPPHTSASYAIPEICCIASSTRFLFLSASHNVPLCLLDNIPNNSSERGCHGYCNRSDAPHLSLVTAERGVGTKVWESLLSQEGSTYGTVEEQSFLFLSSHNSNKLLFVCFVLFHFSLPLCCCFTLSSFHPFYFFTCFLPPDLPWSSI